jgi:glyoxylase-like metal-dependent hydrolase (beta-lactamase superfamily II)
MDTMIPGGYEVPGYSRSYIIDGDEGVTLIDTGLPNRHGAIIDNLAAIGRSMADVRAIAVTHSHTDHVGGAAALKRETTAPLFASAIDAPAIRGEEASPPPLVLDRVRFLKHIQAHAQARKRGS